jgi:hypothetical protein
MNDPRYTWVLTFEEMRAMTRCDEYPGGLTFESGTLERDLLYEKYNEWVIKYCVYWHSIRGSGIEWTLSPGLGYYFYTSERLTKMLETQARVLRVARNTIERLPKDMRLPMEQIVNVLEGEMVGIRRCLAETETTYAKLRLLQSNRAA